MKTALVTGSNGFVGRHLVETLLSSGWSVLATIREPADPLPIGVDSGNKLSVGSLEKIVTGDIRSYEGWDNVLGNVDVLVHLAGLAHDTRQNKKWRSGDYRTVNTDATQTIARAALRAGVRRFVFVSTIKVNGEMTPLDKPFDESSPPDPQDVYSMSKYEAEKALKEIADETDLEVVIIRPPLVYGAGVKGNMGDLVRMVTKRSVIPLPKTESVRSFIYAGNLADAIKATMESQNASGETFVVSDGRDISTDGLIRMIAGSVNHKVAIIPIPGFLLSLAGYAGDMAGKILGKPVMVSSAAIIKIRSSLSVNSTKIRKVLEWTPPYSMEDGIMKMVGSLEGDMATLYGDEIGTAQPSAISKPAENVDAHPVESNRTTAVSVIIVNYNAGQLLSECVRSVLRSTMPVTVIVSDNGSTDGSIHYLRKMFGMSPHLRIVENKENLGFAKANNIVLPLADKNQILFLNPDCIIEPDTIERMAQIVDASPEVGMAGCLIKNLDGIEQAGCRRMVPTPWRAFVRILHLDKLFPNHPRFKSFVLSDQPLPEQHVYLEALSGAFMLVRKDALDQVGPLDDKYFMHCEDLDWCMRFRAINWKILFVPEVAITHVQGTCSTEQPIRVLWHKHNGMVRFYRKFFKHQYPMLFMALVTATVWIRFVAVLFLFLFRRGLKKFDNGSPS